MKPIHPADAILAEWLRKRLDKCLQGLLRRLESGK
jgi:hypothetical protein